MDIQLDLALDGADAEELEAATRDLQRELGELVDVSRPDAEPAPAGTRAVEVAALGSLVMKVDSAAVGPVARGLQSWLARRSGRTIKLALGEDSGRARCPRLRARPRTG